jgi:ERCC4-type nuclease
MVKLTKKFTVVKDTREKVGKGFQWRACSWCYGTHYDTVHTGDYTIKEVPGLVTVERKASIYELISNMLLKDPRRRLFAEFKRMEEEYRWRFVVIEADFNELFAYASWKFVRSARTKRDGPNTILGSIVSAQLKYGIQFVWAGSHGREVTAKVLRKAYEYHLEELKNEA